MSQAYRPEIDGLRAIAVLGVLAYHVAQVIPGGFAGVDVFFVISGYVITSSIASDLRLGQFTIAGFYERRARRIAPAGLATIALTAVAATIILLPEDLRSFGRSALAAALMIPNVAFWLKAGYFDAAMQSKPLLHTWSLGVEEQFYLLYPLILMALWKRPKALVPVLAALFVASFLAGVVMTEAKPDAAFFLTPFRFWELLAGGLVALRPVGLLARPAAGWAGLAMIAASYVVFDADTLFPGAAALLPVAGAALVIQGAGPASAPARALSLPPLVWIGRVSYSLYLIHWPLIVLIEYRQGAELGPWQAAGVAAASIALAALSWRYVEQPFRRKTVLASRRSAFAAVVVGATVCCLLGGALILTRGLPQRLPGAVQTAYAAQGDRWNQEGCFVDTDGTGGPTPDEIRAGKICSFGPSDRTTVDFLIWGDSHAHAMAPGILAAARRFGARGLFVGAGSCPPLKSFDTIGVREAIERRCADINAAVLDYLKDHKVGAVFMVARWPKYAQGNEYGREGIMFDPSRIPNPVPGEDRKLAQAVDATLDEVIARGGTPVIVMDVPEPGYDVPYAVAKALLQRQPPERIAPSRDAVSARQERARQVLTTEAKKDGALFVDPTGAFCDETSCAVERGGVPLYADSDHITLGAALSASHVFDDVFRWLMVK